MPRVRFRSHSATTAQPDSSSAVPGQRATQEGTTSPESAEYSRVESRDSTTGTGNQATQADYGQTQGRRAGAEEYGEPAESRRHERRPYYGMAGTLLVLSGLLTFFIGITGIIRGIFFNNVATYPFYYSVRSRGITFVVLGSVAFLVGCALLVHMYWARTVAIVIAVLTAVANFMFLPYYPFWSVVVLALNVLIIWELARERGERGRRELARLPCPARPAGESCPQESALQPDGEHAHGAQGAERQP